MLPGDGDFGEAAVEIVVEEPEGIASVHGHLPQVDCARDVPERPDDDALARLRADPTIAEFLRL
jgi:hypothetical protein